MAPQAHDPAVQQAAAQYLTSCRRSLLFGSDLKPQPHQVPANPYQASDGKTVYEFLVFSSVLVIEWGGLLHEP